MMTFRRRKGHCSQTALRGFTLIELLITMVIIAIMATMMSVAIFSAQESAKVTKTKTLIAKLDSIIKNRWEGYRTRRMPVIVPSPPDTSSAGYAAWKRNAQQLRLYAMRDLMRMEMPDRWSDVTDPPVAPVTFDPTLAAGPTLNTGTLIARPTMSQAYLRRYNAGAAPSGDYAGAECLYLIVMAALAEEGDAREVFKPDDTSDLDGDGFREFKDAWGQPIKFLRWAPGFQFSDLQVTLQASVNSSGANTATIAGPGVSSANGAYVGGTAVQFDTTQSGQPFDLSKASRITGYTSTTKTLTLAVQSGSPPSYSGLTAVLAPDPFDPFSAFATSQVPSFALSPLIFSAGPDKCYGIASDFAHATALAYAQSPVNLNPFYAAMDNVIVTSVSGPRLSLMGCARNNPEENLAPGGYYVSSGWVDNIHNHLIGTR